MTNLYVVNELRAPQKLLPLQEEGVSLFKMSLSMFSVDLSVD